MVYSMLFLLSVVFADETMERMLTSYPSLSQREIADKIVQEHVSNGLSGAQLTIHNHTRGTIFEYRYSRDGIPLWGQKFSVLVDRDRALLRSGHITDGLFKSSDVFDISASVGTEIAISSLLSTSQVHCRSLSLHKQEQRLDCAMEDVVWRTHPRLMKIYWSDHDEIVPAYRLELVGTHQSKAFAQEIVIDASTGEELYSASLRVHVEDYYVWADEDGFFPTPFGASSGSGFAFTNVVSELEAFVASICASRFTSI